jgi:uncharacterized protein YndB with AHSA1/START domain
MTGSWLRSFDFEEEAVMSDAAYLIARFTPSAETTTVDFALTFDNHLDDVWSALTDSRRLPVWLAPGAIEPRPGGWARLDFAQSGGLIESPVTDVEYQRRLEYSWSRPGEPVRPLRWDLEPIGPMTRLTLRLSLPTTEDVARAAAGWAAHLEMLWAALMGVPVKFPAAAFKAAREAYGRQLADLQRARPPAAAA